MSKRTTIWIASDVAHVLRMAAAKLGISVIHLVTLLIFQRDDDAWQAVYWARKQVQK